MHAHADAPYKPPMNQPLRILHVISRLDGYGAARLLRDLAKHQTAAGWAVTVATLSVQDGVERELQATGVDVHNLRGRWLFDPVAVVRLASLRRRIDVDVTHLWDERAAAHTRTAGCREPIVATWNSTREPGSALPGAWRRKAVALRPGVSGALPSPCDKAAALAALNLSHDVRIIATAGPLARRKQLDDAIWCFELVRVLHPAARLVMFGDGADRSRLERFAELVSEPDCVRFAGYRPDFATLLPHADVFWQLDPAPTTPYALLEAMAAGVPSVASDVPAHRAAIVHGETGLLTAAGSRADVARATDQLLSDAAAARRLGASAAEAMRRDWPLARSLAAVDELYSRATAIC
jgi:glycosyltransferase involved in cell wall biosynthesis